MALHHHRLASSNWKMPGSPTSIGEAGKGLQALFVMMNGRRLAVGIQGAATANMATLHAIAYAKSGPRAVVQINLQSRLPTTLENECCWK